MCQLEFVNAIETLWRHTTALGTTKKQIHVQLPWAKTEICQILKGSQTEVKKPQNKFADYCGWICNRNILRYKFGKQLQANQQSYYFNSFNIFSPNPTKQSNTLKQFVDKLPTNCLSVLDHFVELALKGLTINSPKTFNFYILRDSSFGMFETP